MSQMLNSNKMNDKNKTDLVLNEKDDEGKAIKINGLEECTYTVTISKKPSTSGGETTLSSGQKSFISIHSTDQPCHISDTETATNLDECNLEVLSLNEVFPSTSEESLSNDCSPDRRKRGASNKLISNAQAEKSPYMPTNSKSSTISRSKDAADRQTSVFSDYDIPKNTLHVLGSNPGEPKMLYTDTPKKLSKTMKKFLRNMDKHKSDQGKTSEKPISKLTTVKGILKEDRCDPECTGDSTVQGVNDIGDEATLPFQFSYNATNAYNKQNPDKNVTFNTQVVIIHFTGDLCVGQSIEALSKEKDQQARNSELRKTFLTKFNEFWPTPK